jgi:hypothetical protein
MKLKGISFRCATAACFFLSSALFLYSGCVDRSKPFEQYEIEINKLNKEQQSGKALALLEDAKMRFPENKKFQINNYYRIAFDFYRQGRLNQSCSLLEKISKEYSDSDVVWALFARVLIRKGDFEAAENILKRYPNNPDSFADDIKKKRLSIWVNYNLAACYALSGKKDLALEYLSLVLFGEGFDMKKSFLNIDQDPDFTSLRNDKRYVFLKGVAFSENFDDAIVVLEKQVMHLRELIVKIGQKQFVGAESIKELSEIRKNIYEIHTVAPLLMEIQRKGIDCIDQMIQMIASDSGLAPGVFEARCQEIIRDLQTAKASQHDSQGR